MAEGELRIDSERLHRRIAELAAIGAIDGGGCCRLALTDADRDGRDLAVRWMREAGLEVVVDRIGNIVAQRPGRSDGPPVMTGSHLDTVATGGRFDGPLGVLAGLEVIETLNDAGVDTTHPLAVAVFTNEEGVRFAPDMMGSLGFAGLMDAEEILAVVETRAGTAGDTVGSSLERIGYAGDAPVGSQAPRAFVGLHVEQGPVLEEEGFDIGVVERVQGISWQEFVITGVANHAGTTPLRLRRDAGYAAAAIATEVRASPAAWEVIRSGPSARSSCHRT